MIELKPKMGAIIGQGFLSVIPCCFFVEFCLLNKVMLSALMVLASVWVEEI